jgi:hypothetical protein
MRIPGTDTAIDDSGAVYDIDPVSIVVEDVADINLVKVGSVYGHPPIVGVTTETEVSHLHLMLRPKKVIHFADGHIPSAVHIYQ